MRRVLLVGNTSKIGRQLILDCPKDIHLIQAGRSGRYDIYLNLLEVESFKQIDASYDCAIILAGLNNISEIEGNRSMALKINFSNTIKLTDTLNKLDIPCLFVSSSCVFAADTSARSEFSPKNPSVYYGELKALVEDHLLNAHSLNSIIRLTKVVDDDFVVYSWMYSLSKNIGVSALKDLYVAPIHIQLLTPLFYKWCRFKESRIVHISSREQISYYYWANLLAESIGLPKHLIRSTTIGELRNKPGYIPVDSRLSCSAPHSVSMDIEDTIAVMSNYLRSKGI